MVVTRTKQYKLRQLRKKTKSRVMKGGSAKAAAKAAAKTARRAKKANFETFLGNHKYTTTSPPKRSLFSFRKTGSYNATSPQRTLKDTEKTRAAEIYLRLLRYKNAGNIQTLSPRKYRIFGRRLRSNELTDRETKMRAKMMTKYGIQINENLTPRSLTSRSAAAAAQQQLGQGSKQAWIEESAAGDGSVSSAESAASSASRVSSAESLLRLQPNTSAPNPEPEKEEKLHFTNSTGKIPVDITNFIKNYNIKMSTEKLISNLSTFINEEQPLRFTTKDSQYLGEIIQNRMDALSKMYVTPNSRHHKNPETLDKLTKLNELYMQLYDKYASDSSHTETDFYHEGRNLNSNISRSSVPKPRQLYVSPLKKLYISNYEKFLATLIESGKTDSNSEVKEIKEKISNLYTGDISDDNKLFEKANELMNTSKYDYVDNNILQTVLDKLTSKREELPQQTELENNPLTTQLDELINKFTLKISSQKLNDNRGVIYSTLAPGVLGVLDYAARGNPEPNIGNPEPNIGNPEPIYTKLDFANLKETEPAAEEEKAPVYAVINKKGKVKRTNSSTSSAVQVNTTVKSSTEEENATFAEIREMLNPNSPKFLITRTGRTQHPLAALLNTKSSTGNQMLPAFNITNGEINESAMEKLFSGKHSKIFKEMFINLTPKDRIDLISGLLNQPRESTADESAPPAPAPAPAPPPLASPSNEALTIVAALQNMQTGIPAPPAPAELNRESSSQGKYQNSTKEPTIQLKLLLDKQDLGFTQNKTFEEYLDASTTHTKKPNNMNKKRGELLLRYLTPGQSTPSLNIKLTNYVDNLEESQKYSLKAYLENKYGASSSAVGNEKHTSPWRVFRVVPNRTNSPEYNTKSRTTLTQPLNATPPERNYAGPKFKKLITFEKQYVNKYIEILKKQLEKVKGGDQLEYMQRAQLEKYIKILETTPNKINTDKDLFEVGPGKNYVISVLQDALIPL